MYDAGYKIQYIHLLSDSNSQNVDELRESYRCRVADITFENPSSDILDKIRPLGDKFSSIMETYSLEGSSHTKSQNELRQLLAIAFKHDANCFELLSTRMVSDIEYISVNKNACVSTFIKVLSWLVTYFKDCILHAQPNKKNGDIFCSGILNKHSLYTMYILSIIGYEVCYIGEIDDKLDISKYNNVNKRQYGTRENLDFKVNVSNETLSNYADLAIDEISKLADKYDISVILGASEEHEYKKLLCEIKKSWDSTMFITEALRKIPYEYSKRFKAGVGKAAETLVSSTLSLNIPETMKSDIYYILSKLYSDNYKAISNLTIIQNNIYIQCYYLSEILRNKYKKVIIFGEIKHDTILLVKACQSLNVKVVIICPNRVGTENLQELRYYNIAKIDYGEAMSIEEYPENYSEIQTLGFQASNEMDNSVYNGETLGMYRSFQFKKLDVKTFSTTYDEVKMYWTKNTMFRVGFDSSKDNITLPAIFSFVYGANNSDISTIISDMKDLYIKGKVCLIDYNMLNGMFDNKTKLPYTFDSPTFGGQKMKFLRGVNMEAIKSSRDAKPIIGEDLILDTDLLSRQSNYRYKAYPSSFQSILKYAIKNTIDSINYKTINISREKYIDTVLEVCLNLPSELMTFAFMPDFSGVTSKILIHSEKSITECEFSLEFSIFLTFMHYLGLDIMVYIPSGGRPQKLINESIYNEFEFGWYTSSLIDTQNIVNNATYVFEGGEVKKDIKIPKFLRSFMSISSSNHNHILYET